MPLQATLNNLKKAFKPYEVLWDEWKLNRDNYFTEIEVGTIEVHRRMDFILITTENLMLCDIDERSLEIIISKLHTRFYQYKKWVLFRFKENLNSFARPRQRRQFYKTPISELEIPRPLKNKLLKLKCLNLMRFYDNKNYHYLQDPDKFEMIHDFCVCYKAQKGKTADNQLILHSQNS